MNRFIVALLALFVASPATALVFGTGGESRTYPLPATWPTNYTLTPKIYECSTLVLDSVNNVGGLAVDVVGADLDGNVAGVQGPYDMAAGPHVVSITTPGFWLQADVGGTASSSTSSYTFSCLNLVSDAVSSVTELGDLSDVVSTAPIAGDFLMWSGAAWIDSKNLPSIDNHTDITITALAPDDIIVYNSGTGQWENEDLQYTPYDYRQTVKLVGNDMDLKFGSWSIGSNEWGKTFPVAVTATATLPILSANDKSKFFKFMVKGGTSFSIKAPVGDTSYSFNLVATGANQDVITCDLTAEDADGTFMVEFWHVTSTLGYVSCPGGVPVTVTSP